MRSITDVFRSLSGVQADIHLFTDEVLLWGSSSWNWAENVNLKCKSSIFVISSNDNFGISRYLKIWPFLSVLKFSLARKRLAYAKD